MEEVSALCCASHGSLSPGVCPVCLHDRLTHLGASLSLLHPQPSQTPHVDTITRVGTVGTISALIHMDIKTTTLNLPPPSSAKPLGGGLALGRSKSMAIQTTKTRRKTLETKLEPTIRELSAQAMAENLSPPPPPFAKSKSTGSNLVGVPSSTKSSPGSFFPRFKASPSAFFRRLRQSPPAPVNKALVEESRVDIHCDDVNDQTDYEHSCFSARSSKMSTPSKDFYTSTNTNTISSRTSSYGSDDSEPSMNGNSSTRTSNGSKNTGSSSFSWEGVLASSVRRLMTAMFASNKPSLEGKRRRKMQQVEQEKSNFCGSSSVSCFMDRPFAAYNTGRVH